MKGYGSLSADFVRYIVISRMADASVKIVTKININQYVLENYSADFHKKQYFVRKCPVRGSTPPTALAL